MPNQTVLVQALLVGLGGFVGSTFRFAVGGVVGKFAPFTAFSLPTLTVNVTGCLAIGAVIGLAESRELMTSELRHFLILGLLGGFTTFSALGLEAFSLLRDGFHLRATSSVLLHLGLGVAAVWLGHLLASRPVG